MDVHQLRVFQAAVKSGGFTKAGEELHISQSTVSQHIKLLEQELGCSLFLRVGKRVRVTEAGTLLLEYAERIFREMKNAEMALREMNEVRRGIVRLGVGPTTLTYRLPPILRGYVGRFPQIELIVLAGNTEYLLAAMKSHNLDLAVVMSTDKHPGLTSTPLGREELVIVLNRKHPLARQATLSASDLASLRFILYEKHTAMQSLISRYFESLGVVPRIAMEVENNEAIKSMVRAGLGASILPLCAVEAEPPDGHLRILRVKGHPLMRELRLLSTDTTILPKAIQELAFALTAGLTEAGVKPRPIHRKSRSIRAS
jgi:LysR family transcriptional activator of glutamate synthase operon